MALSAKEKLFNQVITHYAESGSGFTAQDCADFIQVNRSVVSHYLNRLCDDGLLRKENTRPVRFFVMAEAAGTVSVLPAVHEKNDVFSQLIGVRGSLSEVVALCRSAVDYPGDGLPVLLAGESGVGKSHLASLVYQYALERNVIAANAPFVELNCADYANNPELLSATLFGYTRGAFTGQIVTSAVLLMMQMAAFFSLMKYTVCPQRIRKNCFYLWIRDIFIGWETTGPLIAQQFALSLPPQRI